MARVNIIRESTWIRWHRMFRSFFEMEPRPEWITFADLVCILDSAADVGPDREYVLREPNS